MCKDKLFSLNFCQQIFQSRTDGPEIIRASMKALFEKTTDFQCRKGQKWCGVSTPYLGTSKSRQSLQKGRQDVKIIQKFTRVVDGLRQFRLMLSKFVTVNAKITIPRTLNVVRANNYQILNSKLCPNSQLSSSKDEQWNNSQYHLSSNMKRLISIITTVLEDICLETDKEDVLVQSIYHSTRKPTISLGEYLQRIAKYCNCGEECYVFALIYIDRLQELNPEIILNSQSVHRLIAITTVLAIKFHEDEYYKNDYYAKVAGISLSELNSLESQILLHLNYQLFVDDNTFSVYTNKLQLFAEL